MKVDAAGKTPSAAAPDADAGDGDFTVESASVPFTSAPADTTMEARSEAAPVREEPDPHAAAEGEESASATAKPAAKAAATAKPAAGKPKTLAGRRDVLQGDVDRLTATRTKAQRELDELNQKIAESRRALESGQPADKKPAAAATATKPTATASDKKAAATTEAMPQPPKYRDFDTDDAYDEAYGKWQQDMAAWNQAQVSAVETRLRETVEARFGKADEERSVEVQDRAFATRLTAAKEAHADWAEVAENVKELRSSWFDPEKHGDIETPFLSELAYYNEGDGGEVPYFVGSQDDETRQILADLLPSKALRDALVLAPSVTPLLAHFVTPEGQREWEAMRRMHPVRVAQAIGALHARLVTAEEGSSAPAARHTTTHATAPAKLPVARAGAKPAAQPARKKSFDEWMAEEDAADQAKSKQIAGVA